MTRRFGSHALVLAAAAVALSPILLSSAAHARPNIRSSFFGAYPTVVGSRLDNLPSHSAHCGVCHYDFNGGGTRNPYGARIEAVLGGFPNTDAGRQQAIHSIETEDSDLDGYANLTEITDFVTYSNTPTFPGLTPANVNLTSNVPNLAEITPYLVPQAGGDTQPPVVNLTSPDGGEGWGGGNGHAIQWTATDNIGVVAVDLFWRESNTDLWRPLALGTTNTGSFLWFVPNMPTTTARVLVIARDVAGNAGRDSSSAVFTVLQTPGGIVATTLRDFDLPGTQPLGGGSFQSSASCITCHGGYDAAVEPGHNFRGSMMAQAMRDPLFDAAHAIAEQDAPSSGDLCLRCHSAFGWLGGRSQPTSGAQITAADRDGVACDLCHRMVDPIYQAGVSPAADQAVLAGLLPGHTPTGYSNGQYVVDPDGRKRGPFTDTVAPHPVLASPFHLTSEFCGTCHDVSNPVFVRTGPADYAPGPLDQAPTNIASDAVMPLERTYSEWKHSAYPAGVYAPDFAGNRPDGIVSTCQDCHMRDVSGTGCNDPLAPTRSNLPLHDLSGGSSWMLGVVGALHPTETDPAALAAGALRAEQMLRKAATLDVAVAAEADSFRAAVTVTNRGGHKLPTGYPEGRRMWIHVVARDANGAPVYQSAAYDAASGVLTEDADARIYEAHLGISPGLAGAIGIGHGPSFHFALNDSVYKDNRIPPQGFTNAGFETFGGQPVDPAQPGTRYVDGQNWDVASYALPPTARSVTATLYYQSTSKDYIEFLRDENTSNTAGQTMHDAWVAHGRAAPVAMVADSASFSPVAVGPAALRTAWTLARNPFRGPMVVRLTLERPTRVSWVVSDLLGRMVAQRDEGLLPAGTREVAWTGHGRDGRASGPGVYWVRVVLDGRASSRAAVRLQ